MHLNIVKSKNAQQFYVLEGYRNEDGKCTTRIVKKLGTYEQLHETFGFRTDYEILSKSRMRNLISLTKKK